VKKFIDFPNESVSRSFSRHQYFDSKGMFISMVFSVPILLYCMVMVVCILKHYIYTQCWSGDVIR